MTFKYISIATGSERSRAVRKGPDLRLGLQIEPRVPRSYKVYMWNVVSPNPFSEALHRIWELKHFFLCQSKICDSGIFHFILADIFSNSKISDREPVVAQRELL